MDILIDSVPSKQAEPKGELAVFGISAKDISSRGKQLRQDRSILDGDWRTISAYMGDPRDEFDRMDTPQINGGNKRQRALSRYDDTAEDAVDDFVDGLFGTTTNPAVPWFSFSIEDKDLADFQPVKLYLQALTAEVRKTFGNKHSAFYQWMPEVYRDGTYFGNGVLFDEFDLRTQTFHTRMMPLGQCYCDYNDRHELVGHYRYFRLSERDIERFYGKDAAAKLKKSPGTATTDFSGQADRKHALLHAVVENKGYKARTFGLQGFRYASVLLAEDGERVLHTGGFHEMDFHWLRLGTIRGNYARGMGQKALSSVKGVNLQRRDFLKSSQMAADPMLLVLDDDVKDKMAAKKPGGLIVGGMSRQGRPLASTLDTSGNLPVNQETIELERKEIRRKFKEQLFSVVSEGRTGLTVEEFLDEQQRRLQKMGPTLTQVQAFLVPIINNRARRLARLNLLPPPPPELENQQFEVSMESAMDKAQKVQDANSTQRWLQGVGVVAQFDPSVLDKVDPDSVADVLHTGLGAPAKVLASNDAVSQKRQQRQAAQSVGPILDAATAQADINEKNARAEALLTDARGE